MASASKPPSKPLIGVPWRNAGEEAAQARGKLDFYLRSIEFAGGHAEVLTLQSKDTFSREKVERMADMLDAVLLPGSPRDVDPMWFNARRHERTAESDPQREQTDFALLDCAFHARKPVLAICYGLQSLNVFLGGTLVQDIASEVPNALEHRKDGRTDRFHSVTLEDGSQLARLAGAREATVNTSHHQAIGRPARGLRVVAQAPDRVIEAVELDADGASPPGELVAAQTPHWVIGVQWHPERMTSDALAQALFREFVAAARRRLV